MLLLPPFIKTGGLNGNNYNCKEDDPLLDEVEGGIILDDKLGSVERGMMGSVVVLLHSTGQTQVISSSQEKNTTQQGHRGSTWREKQRSVSTLQWTVLYGAKEEVLDNSNVNSSWQNYYLARSWGCSCAKGDVNKKWFWGEDQIWITKPPVERLSLLIQIQLERKL